LVTVVILGVIGGLAAIALPAYQEGGIRTKMWSVISIGDQATRVVEDFIAKNNAFPMLIEQTGFTATSPDVKNVTVNGENGVVLVTANFSPLTDKALAFVPSFDQNKKIVWKCASDDIPAKYLPMQCR
jgi:Tfp pilus assembly major pilin PilA